MRLGAYSCHITSKNSKTYQAYQKLDIEERHRHRYEFNNKYRKEFADSGMSVVGINPKRDLVEIVEIDNHPWFVGVQFHPEYSSTVAKPHPLFVGFVKAAKEKN